VDAVNLMTIHAAKGLEFDTCFLVNMHQRRREDTSLPRIRELPDGEIEVTALGADGSERAAAEPNRVEEEEKRLLYVALTRARRRLSVSAVTAATFDPERSLLGLLPRSFREKFREALDAEAGASEIEWRSHPLRILRPAEGRKFHSQAPERRDRLRLEPLSFDAYETSYQAGAESGEAIENVPVPPELVGAGEVHRRVPFTLARGRSVTRGVIDLLHIEPGVATVIERLEGPPGPEHRERMDTCLEAVESLGSGREARGVFVIADAPPLWVKRRENKAQQMPLFPT
jgi:hypothetical protein